MALFNAFEPETDCTTGKGKEMHQAFSFGGVQFQLAQCIAKCFSLKKGVELENDRKDIVSGNER